MVITARSTPSRRWATSMTGVMQFVVQLAQEMICGRPCGRFTPCTTVGTVSDFVGADRITYEAPARTCFARSFGGREDPGALQHEVDPQLAPRQLRRVTLGERRDPSAVDDQLALRGADVVVVAPVDGVVLDQVRQVVRVGDVVDRDEVEPIGIEQDLQRRPADPPQAVDRDGRHVTPPSAGRRTRTTAAHR